MRSWATDRTSCVSCRGNGYGPCSHHCTRSTTRSTRGAIKIPGVSRNPGDPALRHGGHAEFRSGSPAEYNGALPLETSRQAIRVGSDEASRQFAAHLQFPSRIGE